jgi:hypothetical protein
VRMAGVKWRRLWRVMGFGILLIICAALTACDPPAISPTPPSGPIAIKLKNFNPKVKTAIARVAGTNKASSLYEGTLFLQECAPGDTFYVWAPGYYIKSVPCNGGFEYEVSMDPLPPEDNPNYFWVGADTRFDSIFGCAKCHSDKLELNEYAEWSIDGHSKSFTSPYFWTTYLGTNIQGLSGQKTPWGFASNGSRFRMPLDPTLPDYGPGYQLDYPDESGNCAFCHAPAAVGPTRQEVNLAHLIRNSWGYPVNVASEGVNCDVCHKVVGVSLDEQGLPYADRPGILSFSFLRPNSGSQFIAGPWSHLEASKDGVKWTCASIYSESEFCAPCHYAEFSGVEIYGSYKEWLDSPYSKSALNYRSCQDCHMQASEPMGATSVAARRACSPENDSFRDFSHNMMKRDQSTRTSLLIPNSVSVTVDASKKEGKIDVNVSVVNTSAGHKLPTDSPLRHLILVVEAKDENGTLLTQVEGLTIPEWGGTGESPQDYAGRPGVIYANLLKDRDTNEVPSVAYWNPTIPAWEGSDTRLLPGQHVLSQYSFVLQSHGDVTVTANLIYRSAFIDIARQRGWTVEDVLVNWGQSIVLE